MEVQVEVRGRGKKWRVHYPDEERLGSPVPVFDRNGEYKETIICGTDRPGMTEAHFTGTQEEALAYAEYIAPGAEVKVVRTNSQAESLEKARQAAARKRAETHDEE